MFVLFVRNRYKILIKEKASYAATILFLLNNGFVGSKKKKYAQASVIIIELNTISLQYKKKKKKGKNINYESKN